MRHLLCGIDEGEGDIALVGRLERPSHPTWKGKLNPRFCLERSTTSRRHTSDGQLCDDSTEAVATNSTGAWNLPVLLHVSCMALADDIAALLS